MQKSDQICRQLNIDINKYGNFIVIRIEMYNSVNIVKSLGVNTRTLLMLVVQGLFFFDCSRTKLLSALGNKAIFFHKLMYISCPEVEESN